VGLTLVVSACTSSAGGTDSPPASSVATSQSAGATSPATSSAPSSSAVQAAPVKVTASLTAHKNVNPVTPITVTAANGTLNAVKLLNPQGRAVTGEMSADKTSWHTTEVLGYSKTYRLTATAASPSGEGVDSLKHKFTTLTPSNMTMPYLQRMGGYTLAKNATYGVAIVPVVHFDEAITDKAAAQKALTVTTTPHVDGSWYWADDQDVHWRPEHYYKPGTKVTIAANVYGVQVGPGLYGESDVQSSFTIGRKQITVADDNAPKVDKVRVYKSGKLVRTMNTSMGKHSGETVNGTYINFYTLEGTYTVLEHDNPAIMSSASYGLPTSAPGGYAAEPIYYSTKISTDGIYLHQLLTTIYAQDNGYDVSHGCLNMNTANSMWFYNHSMIGDPVVIRHTGGPTIAVWEGGDWSVPWSKWLKGSATS
jgi:lipoprotein-anchoring transpeptidase ErfK/SrfK